MPRSINRSGSAATITPLGNPLVNQGCVMLRQAVAAI